MTTDVERRARLPEFTRQVTGDDAEPIFRNDEQRLERIDALERASSLAARHRAAQSRRDDAEWLKATAFAKGILAIQSAADLLWVSGGRARDIAELKGVPAITADDFPSPYNDIAAAFLNRGRDRRILAWLLGVLHLPMNAPVAIEGTATEAAARTATGKAIKVLHGVFAPVTLLPKKIAAIMVATNESLRSRVALDAILDVLAGAMAEGENLAFLDVNAPDSILAGAPHFAATGSSATQVLADLRALLAAVPGTAYGGAWCMSQSTASFYATLAGTSGALLFPNVAPNGGELLGLPVFVTKACEIDDSPPSRVVALLSPSDICVADDGRARLDLSQKAAIEQSATPTGDVVTPAAATQTLTSMFTAESTAIRAVREISWTGRSGAAAYMTTSY